jgi:hypothetical protein
MFGGLQRKCACGKSASALADQCEDCKRKKAIGLQTKLAVSAPDDAYEREADQVADAVSATGIASPPSRRPTRIQRLPAGNALTAEAPPSVQQTLARSGRPLDPSARALLEPRLGVSFADVRVYDDAQSAESANDIDARAYTHGHDIVFAPGQYTPQTPGGLHLLAHELTHVVQQNGARPTAASASPVQRDLAIDPQAVDKKERPLSEQNVKDAIQFNKNRIRSKKAMGDIRDVLGIAREPAESDADLALAVARWQFAHGAAQDGLLGPITMMLLVEELQAEAGAVNKLGDKADALKKSVTRKNILDVDERFCGCEEQLKNEIKSADSFIANYSACGTDKANKTGRDIEACVSKRVGPVKVLASTASTGAITADCQRTGPCAALLCRIDLAHEQIHSVHTGDLKQQAHGDAKAFNTAFNDATDWVADEIDSRNTDKSLANWALKVLERTCP